MKKETCEDYQKIMSRLNLFSQQINEIVQLLTEGLRCGVKMHQVSVETLPKVLRDIAETEVTKSSLFKSFIEKPKEISEKDWENIITEAKKVIEEEVKPSYLKLSDFLVSKYL